jgi:hypothetical protein
MPLNKHYGGHGDEVMSSMTKTYGKGKKAKSVFYATENKLANRGKVPLPPARQKAARKKEGKRHG